MERNIYRWKNSIKNNLLKESDKMPLWLGILIITMTLITNVVISCLILASRYDDAMEKIYEDNIKGEE